MVSKLHVLVPDSSAGMPAAGLVSRRELEATIEELEALREEEFAARDELRSLNDRLLAKIDELEQTTDNLSNLLHSTRVITIFLDPQLRIRWFSPNVGGLLNLLVRDIGRPIGDLVPKFHDPDLLGDAEHVLATLVPVERDVRDGHGRWFARRALPYRTLSGHVDGVVLTFDDITGRKTAEERSQHLALHDALTGLPNRVLLQDRLTQALARARRECNLVALMVLDLDGFKEVNDTLGHPAGDELLKQVAQRIAGSIRESDTLARLGGDEFALVQSAVRQHGAATALAGKVRRLLAAPITFAGHKAQVTASIGIALFPNDGAEAGELLKNADLALYRAKREGRGQHRFFEPAMDAELRIRRRREQELRRALERDEFVLVYQPQLDLRTGALTGVEALARWRHPEHGWVLPGEFIPVAEASGLILPLGAWVLREACRQAAVWCAQGLNLTVAVNVSPAQLRHPDILEGVSQALRASDLDPGLLELEITEGVVMETFGKDVPDFLARLAAHGVRLAIDDFGTGYSSLAYLRRLPVQRIKIDRSFVHDIGVGHEGGAVVRAIVDLGHALGKEVLAEGVESEAQLAFLEQLGCDAAQGFLIARPQTAAALRHLRAGHRPELPPLPPEVLLPAVERPDRLAPADAVPPACCPASLTGG